MSDKIRENLKIVRLQIMPVIFEQKEYKTHNMYTLKFHGILGTYDLNEFKKIFSKCLGGKKFGIIFDLRDVETAPASLIMEQATYMRDSEPQTKNKLIASSVVLDSPVIRGILKTLFTIKSPVAPNFISNEFEEALEFVEDHVILHCMEKRKN